MRVRGQPEGCTLRVLPRTPLICNEDSESPRCIRRGRAATPAPLTRRPHAPHPLLTVDPGLRAECRRGFALGVLAEALRNGDLGDTVWRPVAAAKRSRRFLSGSTPGRVRPRGSDGSSSSRSRRSLRIGGDLQVVQTGALSLVPDLDGRRVERLGQVFDADLRIRLEVVVPVRVVRRAALRRDDVRAVAVDERDQRVDALGAALAIRFEGATNSDRSPWTRTDARRRERGASNGAGRPIAS